MPPDLTVLCTGEDGHLWVCEGSDRRVRLTWSPEDFAVAPGLPPLPGVLGDLEDALVFAHPTSAPDGERIAAFGLLPTDDEGWDDEEEGWIVAGTWPSDIPDNDVAGPGLLIEDDDDVDALLEAFAEPSFPEIDELELADEDEDDEPIPAFWPGGKVFVLDRDGVQVTQAFEFEDGTPTHIEWTPDGQGLLVLHQEEEHLLLHRVDAHAARPPELLGAGAPIFWSWQPGEADPRSLAVRLVPPSGGPAQVAIGNPSNGWELEHIADAGTFYVPAWHPDGTSLLYATAGSREDELILADARGKRLSRLLSYPGRAAFAWDRSGRHVSLAVAPEGSGPFQLLEQIDVAGDTSKTLWRGPFLAFLQVDHGLVLCLLDADSGRLQWLHLTEDGTSRALGQPFTPAREALVALHFFEQVGGSHPWLSPDGRFLICSGWLEGDVPDGEIVPPQVVLTPLDGGPPRSLGPGRFACFAPPRTARR